MVLGWLGGWCRRLCGRVAHGVVAGCVSVFLFERWPFVSSSMSLLATFCSNRLLSMRPMGVVTASVVIISLRQFLCRHFFFAKIAVGMCFSGWSSGCFRSAPQFSCTNHSKVIGTPLSATGEPPPPPKEKADPLASWKSAVSFFSRHGGGWVGQRSSLSFSTRFFRVLRWGRPLWASR